MNIASGYGRTMWLPTEDNPVNCLLGAIVEKAIDDWRDLIRSRAWLDENPNRWCSFDELRYFFKSEWGAFVMQNFCIEPEYVLERLEAELREAMLQPPARKKRKDW